MRTVVNRTPALAAAESGDCLHIHALAAWPRMHAQA
jgi:hypothetical protein